MSPLAEDQSGLIDGEAVSHFEPLLGSRAAQSSVQRPEVEAAALQDVSWPEALGKQKGKEEFCSCASFGGKKITLSRVSIF